MRPGQNNKRMRGRPNNRKGPNPLTRSFESSGPDVKIRGTAHHIGEKYLQLARDAQTSGDPVMAESYLQHAEHYFRLIAAAQQAQQHGPGAYQGQQGEANVEEAEDDSDFAGMPDRFASPAERFAPPQPSLMPQPQPSPAQPGPERSFHNNGDRQGFTRPERAPRPERPFQDRNYRDREYQANPEKPYQEQRPYQERNGRGRDQENRGNRQSAEGNPAERRPSPLGRDNRTRPGRGRAARRAGRRNRDRRILPQHGPLEFLQPRTRVDPQLLAEQDPALPVNGECFDLAGRTVLSQHQLSAQPLAQRVLGDERL